MIFNQEIYHKENLVLAGKPFVRNAYRAVIYDSGKLLMVYSRINKEFKFSGGGKEPGETIIETLSREVKEVGYSISRIQEIVGIITEYNTAQEKKYNYFKMISEYYLVTVDSNLHVQKLDDYEKKLAFEPKWIYPQEAFDNNKETIKNSTILSPWIERETIVLEKLLNTRSN